MIVPFTAPDRVWPDRRCRPDESLTAVIRLSVPAPRVPSLTGRPLPGLVRGRMLSTFLSRQASQIGRLKALLATVRSLQASV